VRPDEQAALLGKRLRELGGDVLDSYARHALNTWGTLTDLKHFLPRILELHAKEELSVDLPIIYGKVVQEGPWFDNELDALFAHACALFERSFAGTHWDMSEVLESVGYARMNVTALLERSFTAPLTDERATALAKLVESQASALGSGTPTWIWWKEHDSGAVSTWLLSGMPHRALLEAFERAPEHVDAGAWAVACDVIEALGGTSEANDHQ
jgi:hypothetical protein